MSGDRRHLIPTSVKLSFYIGAAVFFRGSVHIQPKNILPPNWGSSEPARKKAKIPGWCPGDFFQHFSFAENHAATGAGSVFQPMDCSGGIFFALPSRSGLVSRPDLKQRIRSLEYRRRRKPAFTTSSKDSPTFAAHEKNSKIFQQPRTQPAFRFLGISRQFRFVVSIPAYLGTGGAEGDRKNPPTMQNPAAKNRPGGVDGFSKRSGTPYAQDYRGVQMWWRKKK